MGRRLEKNDFVRYFERVYFESDLEYIVCPICIVGNFLIYISDKMYSKSDLNTRSKNMVHETNSFFPNGAP